MLRVPLCLAASLFGDPLFMNAQQIPCSTEVSNASMQTCEANRYKEANKDLQATYTQLLHQTSPTDRSKLTHSQAAWVRFRTANAKAAVISAGGGTLGPLLQITTLADMTAARTTELKKLLR